MTPPTHQIDELSIIGANRYVFVKYFPEQCRYLIGGVMTPPYRHFLILNRSEQAFAIGTDVFHAVVIQTQ